MLAAHSLAPNTYVNTDVFNKEQCAIFQSLWQFVGFKHQLASHNDFITKGIGGMPVVVQNFKGELCALLNVCSHRKATLQTQCTGNRALRCPYHAWNYGAKGKLLSVPMDRSDFGLSAEERDELGLTQFALAEVGDFVFVRVSEQGPTIEDFLGPYYEILLGLSSAFPTPVHQESFDWSANWKLAVETVLEVYHVASVHPESFSKLAKPECEIIASGLHNTGNTPLLNTPKKWWQGVRKHLKVNQHESLDEYNHFFIYPNLAIGITAGSLMSVQTYDPLSSEKSVLRCHLNIGARTDEAPISQAVLNAVKSNFIEFNRTTLEEDREIAESCQHNMSVNNKKGILGKCEGRIQHFHQSYHQTMNEHDQVETK